MARRTVAVLWTLLAALLAVALAYVVGIRSKSPAARNAARRFHRYVGNPLQMRRAGAPGSYASVIRHRGRKTGRTFETPVWAVPTEDGFVIAVVYGPRTDWLENVLTSGTAVIVQGGRSWLVDRPEIVPLETVESYFPAWDRCIHRRIHVDRCLRVHRAEVVQTPASAGSSGGRRV